MDQKGCTASSGDWSWVFFLRKFFILISVLCLSGIVISCQSVNRVNDKDKITVAAYYFPNYHTDDPRNIITKGPGWSEWELVRSSKPRFPGHHQPNVPLWGYTDEKDPRVMQKKIDAASDNGIDCFIFDGCFRNLQPA